MNAEMIKAMFVRSVHFLLLTRWCENWQNRGWKILTYFVHYLWGARSNCKLRWYWQGPHRQHNEVIMQRFICNSLPKKFHIMKNCFTCISIQKERKLCTNTRRRPTDEASLYTHNNKVNGLFSKSPTENPPSAFRFKGRCLAWRILLLNKLVQKKYQYKNKNNKTLLINGKNYQAMRKLLKIN